MPTKVASQEREKRLVAWMSSIQPHAQEVFLLGDVFDFWFDYKHVIPKGFVRLQAKIAEFTDSGIPVHMFPGNHDMWLFGYFEEELGVTFHKDFYQFTAQDKQFLLHHGDGLGPGDHGYKFLKKVFGSKVLQKAFGFIHPDWGISMANFWSRTSSKKTREKDAIYHGKDKEWLVAFCEDYLKEKPNTDYFICGHRHLPLDITLSNGSSRYINLGDWLSHYTYACFDGNNLELMRFTAEGLHEKANNLPSD